MSEHNPIGLAWSENGFRHITNNQHEIHTPADLQSLKIRTMENQGHMNAFRDLGASPAPWPAFKRAWAAVLMLVVVIGGIYGGIFTPTEAAAVAVFYALFVGVVIYRELTASELWPIFVASVKGTATSMLIIAAAAPFSFLIRRSGLPAVVGEWINANFNSAYTFLLAVNILRSFA